MIANCQLPIANLCSVPLASGFQIGNRQLAIGN
jgi:hypothetical protein